MRSESEMEGKGKQATTKLVSEKTSYEVCTFFWGVGEKWSEVMYAKNVVYKGKHSQVTMY